MYYARTKLLVGEKRRKERLSETEKEMKELWWAKGGEKRQVAAGLPSQIFQSSSFLTV